MNLEVLDSLGKEINKTGNGDLIELFAKAEEKLSQTHNSGIMFVSDVFGYKQITETLYKKYNIGVDLSEYIPDNGTPHMVVYTYGTNSVKSEKVTVNKIFSYEKITVACDLEAISKCNISVFIYSDVANIPNDILAETDTIILVSNAIMALSMSEKKWLRSITSVFDADNICVGLYNIDKLNDADEQAELLDGCKKILNKIDNKVVLCPNLLETLNTLNEVVEKKIFFDEKRKQIIVKCLVNELQKQLELLLEACAVDVEALNKQVEEIEKERKNIELSGKIVVENSISNLYSELKNTIVEAADDYNDNLYDSIQQRIKSSVDLEKDAVYIPVYLKKAWENFSDKINELIAKKNSEISEILATQIESDCETISEMIDLSYVKFNLRDIELSNTIRVPITDIEKIDRNKKIKKGVVAASIGLALFVNPVFIVPAFVVPSVLKNKKAASIEDIKEKVLGELFSECVKVKNGVIEQIQKAIEETEADAKENVKAIYSQNIESLMNTLMNVIDKVAKAHEKKDILENIAKHILPDISNEE